MSSMPNGNNHPSINPIATVSIPLVSLLIAAVVYITNPPTFWSLAAGSTILVLLTYLGFKLAKEYKIAAGLVILVCTVILAYNVHLFLSMSQVKPTMDDEARKHFNQGLNLFNLKDFVGALDEFKAATDLKQEFFQAVKYTGLCNMELGNYEDATETLKSIFNSAPNEISPLLAKTYYLRGLKWCVERNEIEASKWFHCILKYDPDLYRKTMESVGKCR